MFAIPEGYYFANKQNDSIALRYFKDDAGIDQLEIFNDDKRLPTNWKTSETSFTVTINRKRFSFKYHISEKDTSGTRGIIKKSTIPAKKGSKDIEYEFQSPWPKEEGPTQTHDHSTLPKQDVYDSIKQEGFTIISNVYSQENLDTIFKEYHQEGKKFNKRGWYALSQTVENNQNVENYLNILIEPIKEYIDFMLGEDAWEHNQTLQVAFADRSRTAAVPTYHIDKMFLNKGEPFSLLVGVPLIGELDKCLSGNLSVVPKSHTRLQDILKETDMNFLNDPKIDKNVKLRKCFHFATDETMELKCINALPTSVQLCHYRLIHGVEKNHQKQRAIAYVRIRIKKDHPKRQKYPKIANWVESAICYNAWDLWE